MEKEQGFCEGKRLQDSKTRGRKIRKKDTTSFACSLFARPFPPRLLHWCTRRPRPFSRVLGRRWEARVEPRLPSRPFLLLFSASSCRRPRVFLSSSPPRGGGQGSGREVSVSDEVKSSCPRSTRLLPAERGLAKSNPLLPASPRGRVFTPLRSRSLGEVSGRGQTSKKGKTFFSSIFLIFIFF